MKRIRGISLITLVITIVIIIILAGVVILNLSQNNPIKNSEKARIMEDVSAFASDLAVRISKLYADNPGLNMKNIDSSEDEENKYYITKLLESLEKEKVGSVLYSDILIVRDGKLYFNEDKKDLVAEDEYNAIIEVLGTYSPSKQDKKDEENEEGGNTGEDNPSGNEPVVPENQSYTITYKLNDETDTTYSTQTKNKGEDITIIADELTREGYVFLGWSENKDATEAEILSGTMYSKDENITLYAIWELQKYTITYSLGGGTSTNIKEYTIETATFSLNKPTRTGYIFAGWTGSNGTTKQISVTISKGSTGNKTYTANWRPEVITSDTIQADPTFYIGKSVKYTGYSESTNTIDWRIYGLDESGNIMLKANDYINLSYKKSSYPTGISVGNSNYNICKIKGSNPLLESYIGTSSNWNEYAISGKTTARGAMTLPEFVNGYNLVNSVKLSVEYLTAGSKSSDGAFTANDNGYVIKKGTGNYSQYISGIKESYNGMKFYIKEETKASYMWLDSVAALDEDCLFEVNFSSVIIEHYYVNVKGGLCPVVSLTSAKLVEKSNGEFVVE